MDDDDFSYNGGTANPENIPTDSQVEETAPEFKTQEQIRKDGLDSVKVSSSDIDTALMDDEVVVTTETKTVSNTENQNVYSIDSNGQLSKVADETVLEATYEFDAKKQLLSDFREQFMQSVIQYPAGFISTVWNDMIDATAKDQAKHILEFIFSKDDRKPNFTVDLGIDFKIFAEEDDSLISTAQFNGDPFTWAKGVTSVDNISRKWPENECLYDSSAEKQPVLDNKLSEPGEDRQTFSFGYSSLRGFVDEKGEELVKFIKYYNKFNEKYGEYLKDDKKKDCLDLCAKIVFRPIDKTSEKQLVAEIEKCMPIPIKFTRINPANIRDPSSIMKISFTGVLTRIYQESVPKISAGDTIKYKDKVGF